MKRIAVMATFSMTVSTSTFAEPHFSAGVGVATCAEFARLYSQQPDVAERIFFSWASGYMTGWNGASGDRILQIDLSVWNADAQRSHIRNYCDAHPLKMYHSAVNDLMNAMKYADAKAHGLEAFGKP